ncbi:hypothetical protein EMIT0P258_30152 [Pseudomonas sp. IT-P258]
MRLESLRNLASIAAFPEIVSKSLEPQTTELPPLITQLFLFFLRTPGGTGLSFGGRHYVFRPEIYVVRERNAPQQLASFNEIDQTQIAWI